MIFSGDIFTSIKQFFTSLWDLLSDGLLFIGGPKDILLSLIDVTVASIFLYYILCLIRDTRAWQLLKGILLILILGMLSRIFGLSTITFILNNTIQIFTIAFVVIFQPELRKALETMGRSGLVSLPANLQSIATDKLSRKDKYDSTIENIVNACDYLAKTRTGALILLERSTPLGELIQQENAFQINAPVTDTMLRQIFYVGTPLHDGAVVIRDNAIAAARIHIPLSDSLHLRTDFGTRHRAAIGASEMGDTIAIVVSEEKGTISIAVDGRLYVLDGPDKLRRQLYRLLKVADEEKASFWSWRQLNPRKVLKRKQGKFRLSLIFFAIAISLVLWTYVQVQINPLDTASYQLSLNYYNEDKLTERQLEIIYPVQDVNIRLKGRKNIVNKITAKDVVVYADLDEIKTPGIHKLKLKVDNKSGLNTRTEAMTPEEITIFVRPFDSDTSGQQDDVNNTDTDTTSESESEPSN